MKTLKIVTKPTALFFLIMTMLQSCIAYQNTPVSLQQAEFNKKRVKVNTSSNYTYHFKQIVLEEDQFYGLKKVQGKTVKIPIDNNEVYKVFLHSKSKSTWTTIAIIVVPVITLAILAATTDYGPGLNYGS